MRLKWNFQNVTLKKVRTLKRQCDILFIKTGTTSKSFGPRPGCLKIWSAFSQIPTPHLKICLNSFPRPKLLSWMFLCPNFGVLYWFWTDFTPHSSLDVLTKIECSKYALVYMLIAWEAPLHLAALVIIMIIVIILITKSPKRARVQCHCQYTFL